MCKHSSTWTPGHRSPQASPRFSDRPHGSAQPAEGSQLCRNRNVSSLRSYSEAGNKEKSNQTNLLYGKWTRLQKKVHSGTNSWTGWRVKVRRNSSPWSGMGTLDCWAFLPGPAQHDSDELRLHARSRGSAASSEAGLRRAGASSGPARPWPGAASGLCICGCALLLSTGGPVPLATPYLLCSRHPHGVRPRGQQGTCTRKVRLRNTRGRQPESRGVASLPTSHASPGLHVRGADHRSQAQSARG